MTSQFVTVCWMSGHAKRADHIEYAWIEPVRASEQVLVFLHEGLGSVAQWRDFPQQLCEALNMRGLVFSRQGYGASSPRRPDEHWGADFMHSQAEAFLPAFFDALGVTTPVSLFGHSDGGTIALLYTAMYPNRVSKAVVLAPHVFVEQICVDAIAAARVIYATDAAHPKSMRSKLSRYHQDVDSAFYGWCDVWLSEAFRSFDMRSLLPQISCPILAIQGLDDAYGTMLRIEDIERLAPQTKLLKLAACGHSPHIDQSEAVIEACKRFLG